MTRDPYWARVYHLRDVVGLSYGEAQEVALAEQREARQRERAQERFAEWDRRQSRDQVETLREHRHLTLAMQEVVDVLEELFGAASTAAPVSAGQMAAALQEVHSRHGGEVPYLRKVIEAFGFTVEQLRAAATGTGPEPDEFDRQVELFQRNFNMTAAEAKIAVIGNEGSERAAREAWNRAAESAFEDAAQPPAAGKAKGPSRVVEVNPEYPKGHSNRIVTVREIGGTVQ